MIMVAAMIAVTGGGVATAAPAAAAEPEQNYIVVLKDGAQNTDTVAATHGKKFGFAPSRTYKNALNGYAASMSAPEAKSLATDPTVDFVSSGREFRRPPDPAPNTELAPFWWQRMGQTLDDATAEDGHNSVRVNIAVIDSGIDGTHPDLNVRGGVDCQSGSPVTVAPVDPFGHGTMVAGIIGAKNNSIGIIGAAAGTPLWSVRVVDDAGTIPEANLLCAVDWVTSTQKDKDPRNDISVANMSITGPATDLGNCGAGVDPFHHAICRSVEAGVTYTVAAGNESADIAASVPSAYDEVLTVTAMADFDGRPGGLAAPPVCASVDWSAAGQSDDHAAFFSNFATQPADKRHTLAAPGVCMASTAPGGYSVDHGTSFASPAVAGAVALCISKKACKGSGKEVMDQFLTQTEAYNAVNADFGFVGDPLRPTGSQYYGYLAQIADYCPSETPKRTSCPGRK
jgi:subtilisin family serine protease